MRILLILVLFMVGSIVNADMYAINLRIAINNPSVKNQTDVYLKGRNKVGMDWDVDFINVQTSGTYRCDIYIYKRVATREEYIEIAEQLQWYSDNVNNKIISASLTVHLCRNDLCLPCYPDILLYQKFEDGSEYINWEAINDL